MSLTETLRPYICGGSSNQVTEHLNEYNGSRDLIQRRGENGISVLQRNISGDALHNSEQRFPPPQCHPDTRVAVQETIQRWATETDYQAPSFMWLYGPPGTGKSAVAQSMAEIWASENRLAGSFFFARGSAGSAGKHLFSTITYQLALHIPELRESIGLAVENDPAICEKVLEEQFLTLIATPMSNLEGGPSREFNLVIIDGLDECNSTLTQSRIIKIIFRALVENNLAIKFLICSRPEPHIRETFDSLPEDVHFRTLVLDETFDPGRDILHYLRQRFSEIRRKHLPYHDASWPSDEVLERLVHSAS
ncbi:hypothetical protein B0H19DRAFT_989334 [Mycena capillaripes]|nr:hypothetical protein B0H19DRAFT_989334 [Mycena capillaripes]